MNTAAPMSYTPPQQQVNGKWLTNVTYEPVAGNPPTMIQRQEVPPRQLSQPNNGQTGFAVDRSDLAQVGFDVQVVELQDGSVSAGTVLAQSPQFGEELPRGSVVTITVATAPPPPTPTPTPTPTFTPEPTPTALPTDVPTN